MNNTEKRKIYMREIYSNHWSRKRQEYGIEQYDRDLIAEISSNSGGGKILEVAIGDGFPYANEFDKMGYDVYGIDLSPTHVDMVEKALPNVNVYVGDAEDLQFPNNKFDVVYCFRSTWYFTNLIGSIDEMIRVVKNNGVVIFDMQNSQHPIHTENLW